MVKRNLWLLLGGAWHDFEGFAATMITLLEGNEFSLHATYDPGILTHLNELGCDLLLSYTCLAENPAGEKPSTLVKFSSAQVEALVQWVQNGGALLVAHAATVTGDSPPALEDLLGGAFVSHPPEGVFQVLPLSFPHPITDGIHSFEVEDELYIERYHPSVTIHMIAVHEQVAYPVVWSREQGLGRVAHIALGHSEKTWTLEPYQRLMLQTIRWLINK